MAEDQVLPQGEGAQEPQEGQEKGSWKTDLYFWVQTLTVILVALVLLSTLVGRLIGVQGSSMVPTLHEGDMLLLQSIGYEPAQGDVVVLRKSSFMTAPVVKRVIAVGGQHVVIDYDAGTVTVDGTELDEPYINEPMDDPRISRPTMSNVDLTVPEGSIFVMGDNRNHSTDSRDVHLGTVDTRYVLGKVWWVLFPFSHFGGVE